MTHSILLSALKSRQLTGLSPQSCNVTFCQSRYVNLAQPREEGAGNTLLMTQTDRDRLVTLKKAKLITQRQSAEELGLSTR